MVYQFTRLKLHTVNHILQEQLVKPISGHFVRPIVLAALHCSTTVQKLRENHPIEVTFHMTGTLLFLVTCRPTRTFVEGVVLCQ